MEGSTAADPFQAERFELRGDGVQLEYVEPPGAHALRRMTLVDADGERRHYQGADIDVHDTNIGTMLTVITSFVFDGDTHKLSVLLPGVNLGDQPSADVTTVAIRTVHRGHLGGPRFIEGPLSRYEAVALTGTAGRRA